MPDVERVFREGIILEEQTRDERGRDYFLRILPYRARTRQTSGPEGHEDGSPPGWRPTGSSSP